MSKGTLIANAIAGDLAGRKGFDNVLDDIDTETKQEIIQSWADIAQTIIDN